MKLRYFMVQDLVLNKENNVWTERELRIDNLSVLNQEIARKFHEELFDIYKRMHKEVQIATAFNNIDFHLQEIGKIRRKFNDDYKEDKNENV